MNAGNGTKGLLRAFGATPAPGTLSCCEHSATRGGAFDGDGACPGVNLGALGAGIAVRFRANAPLGALRMIDTANADDPLRLRAPGSESLDDDGAQGTATCDRNIAGRMGGRYMLDEPVWRSCA